MNQRSLARGDKILYAAIGQFYRTACGVGLVTSTEEHGFVEVWFGRDARPAWYKQGNGVLIPARRNSEGNLEVVVGGWQPSLTILEHLGRWY